MASRTTQGQIVVDPAGGAITVDITNPAGGTADLYASATVNDTVQTVTIDATGGTFTATVLGQTTSAVAYNATAATFQTALEALSTVAPGDIVVTGGPGASAAYTLSFGGALSGDSLAVVTTGAGSLTGGAGTAAVATVTAGSTKKVFPQEITTATTYYGNAGRYTVSLKAQDVEIATETNAAATVDARNIGRISPVWPAAVPYLTDVIAALDARVYALENP